MGRHLRTFTPVGANAGIPYELSPDGQIYAIVIDGSIAIRDVESGMLLRTIPAEGTFRYTDVSFSPDGQTLASGDDNATLHLWDVESGTLLRTMPTRDTSESATLQHTRVYFSPSGGMLDSHFNVVENGRSYHTIRVWDADTGTLLHTTV